MATAARTQKEYRPGKRNFPERFSVNFILTDIHAIVNQKAVFKHASHPNLKSYSPGIYRKSPANRSNAHP